MYYNWKEAINIEELKNMTNLTKNGKIIVFPIETVYGIGADDIKNVIGKVKINDKVYEKIIENEKVESQNMK